MHQTAWSREYEFSREQANVDTAAEETAFPSRYLRFAGCEFDLQRQTLSGKGVSIAIRGKLYGAFTILLERPGEVVSREVLRDRLWGGHEEPDGGANLNTTMNKLRRLLKVVDGEMPLIQTVIRRGYVFTAKVEYAASSIADAPVRQTPAADEWRDDSKTTLRLPVSRFNSLSYKVSLTVLAIASLLFGAAAALYLHSPIHHP